MQGKQTISCHITHIHSSPSLMKPFCCKPQKKIFQIDFGQRDSNFKSYYSEINGLVNFYISSPSNVINNYHLYKIFFFTLLETKLLFSGPRGSSRSNFGGNALFSLFYGKTKFCENLMTTSDFLGHPI